MVFSIPFNDLVITTLPVKSVTDKATVSTSGVEIVITEFAGFGNTLNVFVFSKFSVPNGLVNLKTPSVNASVLNPAHHPVLPFKNAEAPLCSKASTSVHVAPLLLLIEVPTGTAAEVPTSDVVPGI